MRRAVTAVVLAACASPLNPAAAPPPSHPARTESADAAPMASTEIPALGLRLGCAGTVDMVKEIALVDCGGGRIFSVTRLDGATSLDDAIGELHGSSANFLLSTPTREVRTASTYRLEHHNEARDHVNYFADVAREVGGAFYLCIPVPARTPEAATANGDVCATLSAVH